jgi:hypothetical protein
MGPDLAYASRTNIDTCGYATLTAAISVGRKGILGRQILLIFSGQAGHILPKRKEIL